MTQLPCSTVLNNAFLVAMLALASDASAQVAGDAYRDPVTRLRYPQALSQLAYERVVQYENKKLGYCVLYVGGQAHGQVCVYDLGNENLPTGVDNPVFMKALDIAVEGTLSNLNRAPFRGGTITGTGTPTMTGEGTLAKAELRLFSSERAQADGTQVPHAHLILMTTGLGKILKFNYTTSNPKADEFAKESREIVEQFLRYNGDTMLPLLLKVAK